MMLRTRSSTYSPIARSPATRWRSCSAPTIWPASRCRRSPASSTSPRRSSCCRRRCPRRPTGCGSSRPSTELPFAGHPSVGCGRHPAPRRPGQGRRPRSSGVRRRACCPITVDEAHGSAIVTGGRPTVGPALDPAPLLAAVGLDEADFVGPAPRNAGCGLPFTFLSVHRRRRRAAAPGWPSSTTSACCSLGRGAA